jgi:hypothetical protein
MEQQVARYCQAHSINAYMGYKFLNPEDIMKTADKIHHNLTFTTGNPTGILNIHYNKGNMPGNFSIPLLNYHLIHQDTPNPGGYLTSLRLPSYIAANPTAGPEQYPTGIHLGSTKHQILQLLGSHTAVLIHYTTKGHTGHAVCIKKYQENWYLLDSEIGRPINLDDNTETTGWQHISGHTYILSPNIPTDQGHFNPHGPQWNRGPHTMDLVSPRQRNDLPPPPLPPPGSNPGNR